jgi:hypothetical protein
VNFPHLIIGSFLVFGSASCGARHVSLTFVGTEAAGSPKTCNVTPGKSNCADTKTDVPSDQNQTGTVFLDLPKTCASGVHRVVIHDVDSSSPTAYVECALVENPIVDTHPTTTKKP